MLAGFGFCVHQIDGHSHGQIRQAWDSSRSNGRVNIVIAETTKAGGSAKIGPQVGGVVEVFFPSSSRV